jgi:hypothetical protein
MVKDKYVAVSGLALTPNSIKKMHKHQATLLKHAHMTGGSMEIYVSPMKAKRMMSAVKKGKGMKLTMSPDEMEHTMKHGKGVMLPSRKIFKVAKEGAPLLATKGVITHNAPVASLNAGNDSFEVVRGDPVAPSATTPAVKKRGGGRKKKIMEEGGKINLGKTFKNVGRQITEGYKKNVRDTPVGSAIRTGVKSAIVAGAPALVSTLGAPELAPLATAVAKPLADMAVEKAGLGAYGMGMKPMLNSNYNTFLNYLHPAMNPALPPHDHSLTRGGSFKSAGYGVRLRGSGVSSISNVQPLGSAMNPQLPPHDNSMMRGGSFLSAGY